jgi:arginyl-tRNA synthetase
MFKEEILAALQKHVKNPVLEVPPNPNMGDFAFPCFSLSKELKKNPVEIAKDLASKIMKPKCVEKISAIGPYVNFFVDKSALGKSVLSSVLKQKKKYGKSDEFKNEIVAIDFSSPNIGKPFHFGHLRSTIIGESLARILECRGAKVERLNYLGDWGTQFGALMCAYSMWGNKKELDKDPIKYLVDLYVRFNAAAEKDEKLKIAAREWFSKLEKGDKKATDLWGLFKSHSLKEFMRVYKVLGSDFDSYNGESYYARQVDAAIDEVRKKGVTKIDDGALIVRLDQFGIDTPIMLRKSDESSTYASRDVATILDRLHTLKATQILYVVGHEQSFHFNQLFSLMKLIGHDKAKYAHVSFGLYLGSDGQKLSTRKGKIVLMEEVLNDSIALATELIEQKNPTLAGKKEVARKVGVGAVIFGDLLNDRQKDAVFDLQKILSFEGDTGPYVMYSHARAASILRKGKEQGLKPSSSADASLLVDPTEQALLKVLAEFPNKIAHSSVDLKPHIVAQFVIELCRSFNEFYHKCPCLQLEDKKLKLARLSLIEASRQVMENSLYLLGLYAPMEM